MDAPLDDIAAIRLLDEPIRRRVYEWVIEQGRPVGRDETARALEIGRPLAAAGTNASLTFSPPPWSA
jgi:hypothetical protein